VVVQPTANDETPGAPVDGRERRGGRPRAWVEPKKAGLPVAAGHGGGGGRWLFVEKLLFLVGLLVREGLPVRSGLDAR